MQHNTVLDCVKELVDKLWHRDCGTSAECRRLQSINEHYAKIPPKHVAAIDPQSSSHFIGTKKSLIVYTKFGGTNNTPDMQMKKIRDYCEAHGYRVDKVCSWRSDHPGVDLHQAINELANSGGLIVSDLSRLVEHHDDPLRELAPLMHQHFFHGEKTLIALKEGINTATQPGQEALIEFLNELRDIENLTC